MAIKYRAKNGAEQFKPSTDELLAAVEADDNIGFCLACGAECSGIEPDARRSHCESCGAAKVYGAEELLLMGLHGKPLPRGRCADCGEAGQSIGHQGCQYPRNHP